jgi:hypothetical protein
MGAGAIRTQFLLTPRQGRLRAYDKREATRHRPCIAARPSQRLLAHATSGDLDEQVAQSGAKRLEVLRETFELCVGLFQFVRCLFAGSDQKDQCWDEAAVGGDVDSFLWRISLGRRPTRVMVNQGVAVSSRED